MLVKLGADLTILNDSGQKVGDLINKNTDPHMVKSLGMKSILCNFFFLVILKDVGEKHGCDSCIHNQSDYQRTVFGGQGTRHPLNIV